MPAPPTVTDDQIRDAGRDIASAGRRVTGYSLRAQLGGRGEPRRLMAVWEQAREQPDPAPTNQPPQVAAPPLPPDLATQATALRARLAAEFDAAIAAAWIAAERRAAERLGGEVEAARAAAEAARQAQAEADEALAIADAARDAAEAERDRLTGEVAEARAAADRATGQCAAAEAERDRLVAELSQARQALTAAAEERGRLLQRAEAAEAQRQPDRKR
jgi:colicin import membrane protein